MRHTKNDNDYQVHTNKLSKLYSNSKSKSKSPPSKKKIGREEKKTNLNCEKVDDD